MIMHIVLFEDRRKDYGERRMIGIGSLDDLVVLVVHVESDETIRIISMRKASCGGDFASRDSRRIASPLAS